MFPTRLRSRNRSLGLTYACGLALLLAARTEERALTQPSATVDFARDVQPILKEHCFGCHGATQQMGGFRLDRRSTALRGVIRPVLIPGSSESSRLYRRVLGPEFGTQMPPTGALARQDIETLKRWIDQGLDWPDALANEAAVPPPDTTAVRLNDALRFHDAETVSRVLRDHPR